MSNSEHVSKADKLQDNNVVASSAVSAKDVPTLQPQDTPSNASLLRLSKDTKLLTALTNQLQYYFSTQNLSQDVYLNTIMSLNSGYVPITIIAGFANVNRIIARFAAEISVDMGLLEPVFVASLLRQCVIDAEGLEVVLLDQNGKVIGSRQEEPQQQTAQQQQQLQQQIENVERQTTVDEKLTRTSLVFEAIGRGSTWKNVNTMDRPVRVYKSSHPADVPQDANSVTAARASSIKEDSDNAIKSNTIILRDVHADAGEDDVRALFQSEDGKSPNPTITKIQKEVGQCWFITLDPSTSQQDTVAILLHLRSKKLFNEPIKARLKTASVSANDATTASGHNGYRYSKLSSRGGQIYSGDRVNYGRKDYNKSFSKSRGGKDGYHHSFSNKSNGILGKKVDRGFLNKISSSSSPPPPLVDEHFPGLVVPASNAPVVDADSKVTSDGDQGVQKGTHKTTTGYAAALLKPAPPVSEVTTQVGKGSSTMTSKSSDHKKVEDATSTETVSTEGSSADDKSHTSKSETESTSGANAPSFKSWAGGRTFADILKKQENKL